MYKITSIFLTIAILSTTLFSGCSPKNTEITLSISAAASLSDVMNELTTVYQKNNPKIKFSTNYSASGTLQIQIEEGAPVDIFFSAAQKPMNALDEKNLISNNSRRDLLENKVVLIASKNNPLQITDFTDLEKAKIIALGEPESVPVGTYSKEILEYLGIWEKTQTKTTFGSDVRQVLSWVESGDADCGMVYATDASVAKDRVTIICEAPQGSCKPVIYPAAILKTCKNIPEAESFLTFLSTPEAETIFKNYGFSPK